MSWWVSAKCRHHNPANWDTDNLTPGREKLEAQILCAGCPVTKECQAEAESVRIDVSFMVREHYRRDGRNVDVFDDDIVGINSGVVRAGRVYP